MGHFHIFMLYIAGSAGLAVLAVYYFYSLSHHSKPLKFFLLYQASLFAICILNIFHSYSINDLGASPILQEAYYIISSFVSSVFLYLMGAMAMSMAGQNVSAAVRRAYAALCGLLGIVYVVPCFMYGDIDRILVAQKWLDSYIVTLIMGIAIVVYAAFVYMRLRKHNNRAYRVMSLSALIMDSILTGIYVLTVVLSPLPGFDEEGAYLMATDNYFVLWNLLALFFFFRLAQRPAAQSGAPKTGGKTASRGGIVAEREWRLIEGALRGESLFKESGVDLPRLSRMTGLPRNRISRLVAEMTGKTYSEYINSLRLAEFKKIVTGPGYSGTILDAAFDAGFNSKATFYNWIKTLTDLSPIEFVRSARHDSAAGRCRRGNER